MYFGVIILREAGSGALSDDSLALAVGLAYLVAGGILLSPWRAVRNWWASLALFALLCASSIAALGYGLGPALGWALIHGAMSIPALLAVTLGLAVLAANLGLALRLVATRWLSARRSP